MSLYDRAINEHVFEVKLFRQRIEDTLKDIGERPAAEALEDAVPVAEALRQVRPRRSCLGPLEVGFKKPPVVRRRDAENCRLSGQHVLNSRPHGVGQHRPAQIHLTPAHLPAPPFRHSLEQQKSDVPPHSQPDCQQALIQIVETVFRSHCRNQ